VLDIHKIIRGRLGIHRGDSNPFNGGPWRKSSRRDFASIFADLGYTKGAEIGVERGRFSQYLCQKIPNLFLTCVDPWIPYGANTQEKEDSLYEHTIKRLEGMNVDVKRMTSLEASRIIPDGSLDFVYIDALHDFNSVMMDILLWVPKVRSGGIISGHDYCTLYGFGVIPAVHAYTNAHGIYPVYTTFEPIPSWMWVNP
jgi:hypothetical protein